MSATPKPHSVLDDLQGLREEAEQAHSQYHEWKKVPYWDCPLSPCTWFNNDLPLIEEKVRGLLEQKESAMDALNYAWTIICNVSEGDWTKQRQEWQDAADRFRDQYHALLDSNPAKDSDA